MIKSNDQDPTRQRIFDAAMDCFAHAGYAATTTRRICEHAGVNLALLSYHWGSKAELWAAVVHALHTELLEQARLAALEARSCSLSEIVSGFLDQVVGGLIRDPRPLRIMAWAQLAPQGFDPAVVQGAYGPAVQAVISFLEGEQRAGQLPGWVDVPLAVVTFYGLVAEPLLEPAVHRHLFGADGSEATHGARIRAHAVRSGLALLGLAVPGGEG